MKKLYALQTLRGLAALLVVVDHSILRQAEWQGFPSSVTMGAQLSGTLGVAVFFVISGYIMIYTSSCSFGEAGAALAFFKKRIIRIVPLYWTATLLEASLHYRKGGTIDVGYFLSSLVFIPRAVPAGEYMRPMLGVGWTLNYEMLFYVIFAFAMMFKTRRGLVALFASLFGLVLVGVALDIGDFQSPPHTVLGFWTNQIILLFAAGVIIGILPECFRRRLRVKYPVAVAVVLMAATGAWFLILGGSYPLSLEWQLLTWVPCILSVLLCVSGTRQTEGTFVRVGLLGGDMSYALYLFHFFAIVAAEKICWLLLPGSSWFAFIPAATCLSLLTGYAVHRLIEGPYRTLFARFTSDTSAHSSRHQAPSTRAEAPLNNDAYTSKP